MKAAPISNSNRISTYGKGHARLDPPSQINSPLCLSLSKRGRQAQTDRRAAPYVTSEKSTDIAAHPSRPSYIKRDEFLKLEPANTSQTTSALTARKGGKGNEFLG